MASWTTGATKAKKAKTTSKALLATRATKAKKAKKAKKTSKAAKTSGTAKRKLLRVERDPELRRGGGAANDGSLDHYSALKGALAKGALHSPAATGGIRGVRSMETTQFNDFNRELYTTVQGLFRQGFDTMHRWNDEVETMCRLAQRQQAQAAQTTTQLVETWLTMLRQGRDQFRQLVDENFRLR